MFEIFGAKMTSTALPFLLAVADGKTKINWAKIAEGLITGVAIGLLMYFFALPKAIDKINQEISEGAAVTAEKIETIRRDISRLEQTVNENRADRERKVGDIERRLTQIQIEQASDRRKR